MTAKQLLSEIGDNIREEAMIRVHCQICEKDILIEDSCDCQRCGKSVCLDCGTVQGNAPDDYEIICTDCIEKEDL